MVLRISNKFFDWFWGWVFSLIFGVSLLKPGLSLPGVRPVAARAAPVAAAEDGQAEETIVEEKCSRGPLPLEGGEAQSVALDIGQQVVWNLNQLCWAVGFLLGFVVWLGFPVC